MFDKDEVNIYDANKQQSLFLVTQSYKNGDASKQTYGTSP